VTKKFGLKLKLKIEFWRWPPSWICLNRK